MTKITHHVVEEVEAYIELLNNKLDHQAMVLDQVSKNLESGLSTIHPSLPYP